MHTRTLLPTATLTALLVALLSASCERSKPAQPAQSQPHAGIDLDDPASCKGCHGNIVAEWSQSMHSRAHHDRDPIYGNMRSLRMKVQGDAVGGKCMTCHNPRAPEAPDSTAGRAGVSCATCHHLQEVLPGKKGHRALVRPDTPTLRSARDRPAGASPAHGTGPALAALADGKTLCLSCHNSEANPQGAPTCTTGPEHAASASAQSCTSCHMPTVAGPAGQFGRQDKHASHAFLGPHRAWYQDDPSLLQKAVSMTASFEGDALSVTLKNLSAHGFPSGFPGRLALVQVAGLDADGEPVWKNITSDPMIDSPQSVLNKVYVGADGKPTLAPFATALKRDARLKPDETRTLTYALPPTVKQARVRLVFFLGAPKLMKKLNLSDAPEAKPRVIAEVVATR